MCPEFRLLLFRSTAVTSAAWFPTFRPCEFLSFLVIARRLKARRSNPHARHRQVKRDCFASLAMTPRANRRNDSQFLSYDDLRQPVVRQAPAPAGPSGDLDALAVFRPRVVFEACDQSAPTRKIAAAAGHDGAEPMVAFLRDLGDGGGEHRALIDRDRSEERRVGKECRSRW